MNKKSDKKRAEILVYKHGLMNDKQLKLVEEFKKLNRQFIEKWYELEKVGLIVKRRGCTCMFNIFTKEAIKKWDFDDDPKLKRSEIKALLKLKSSLSLRTNEIAKVVKILQKNISVRSGWTQ